jgi:hypothetical protein
MKKRDGMYRPSNTVPRAALDRMAAVLDEGQLDGLGQELESAKGEAQRNRGKVSINFSPVCTPPGCGAGV